MIRFLRLPIAILLGLLGGFLRLSIVDAQSSSSTIQILNFDTQSFPTIRFSFRLLNSDGSVVEGLTTTNITLEDFGGSVQNPVVLTGQDTPRLLVFVIDTGFASDTMTDETADVLRGALTSLRDHIDTVIVLQHSDGAAGQVLFGPEADVQHFREWINTYRQPRVTSNRTVLDSLDGALAQIELMNANGIYAPSILYIGQLIEIPVLGNFDDNVIQLHQRASRLGVPIYSFNLGVGNTVNTERVDQIATSSTNVFHITNGQDLSLILQDLYARLARQSLMYTVQYQLAAVNAATDQYTMQLWANGVNLSHNYSVNVDPPIVSINQPFPGVSIERIASRLTNPTDSSATSQWVFDTSSVDIHATVAFPDGIQRSIASAQFLFDGAVLYTLPSPTTVLDYSWDITQLTQAGSYPHTVQVSVTDTYGLTASSPAQQLAIVVTIPEDATTTVITKTPCEQDPNSAACLDSTRTTTISIAAAVIFGIIALVASIAVFRLRKKLSGMAGTAGKEMVRIVSTVRDSIIRSPEKAYGEFRVIQAEMNQGKTFPMRGMEISFGRDTENTDVQLFPLEQPANAQPISCSIGGKHCTVSYERNAFKVISHKAYKTAIKRAGTQTVEPIASEDPTPLNNGDELILGSMSRNGARLSFRVTATGLSQKGGQHRINTIVNDNVDLQPNRRISTKVNDEASTLTEDTSVPEATNAQHSISKDQISELFESKLSKETEKDGANRTNRRKKLEKLR